MTMPISVKKKDGGRISGPANVPSVIEIAMIGQLPNAKPVRTVFHGSYTTPPANMQTLAGALWTALSGAWSTNLATLMATASSVTSVQVRDMTSFTNPIAIGTGTAVPGTSVSVPMPSGAAIVMTENIATRGKGMKGRVYLWGWATNADAGGGAISPATQTAINAFGTAVFNAITTNTLTPCVAQVARQQYQGITGTIHAPRGAGHVNVTTYQCRDLLWDAQRRRGQP
jgi:hypothetical protein